MRKFKIKNRQKRRYTRKNPIQSPFYLYKSIAISLIPIILIITAAFSMVLLINNKSLIKQQPNIIFTLPSIPNLSFSNFINYTQKVKNTTFQARNKSFFTTSQITQNIYYILTKFLQYLDPQPLISKITNTVPPVLNNLGKIIIIFTNQLGIVTKKFFYSSFNITNLLISIIENKITNLFTISINVIFTIITTINTTITNFVNTINVLLTKIIHILTNILSSIYKIIPSMIHTIKTVIMNIFATIANTTNVIITKTISALTNILSSIYKIVPPMMHIIKTIIMNFLVTIINSLQLIENSIIQFLNQLINLIKSPFIELNKEMQPIFLFTNKSTQILKQSTSRLITNTNTISKFISSRTKNPASLTPQINSGKF